MLINLCATILIGSQQPSARLESWGRETVAFIKDKYSIPNSPLFSDAYSKDESHPQPAFNWGAGVWLSALNAATKSGNLDPLELKRFTDATDLYWNVAPPVAGFDVLPYSKDPERFYDDNEWMVMGLCDASQILKSKSLEERASEALRFVLSGTDDKLGGGIYWKEQEKTSKNACSNGPGAAAALSVYRLNKDPELLAKAESLYAWCKGHLQDPEDHLFWDNVNLDGTVQKTKWSYNTALMIRTGSELFRITKKPKYAEDVQAMVKSSVIHWIDLQSGAIKDVGRFAHLLIESWLWADQDIPRVFAKGELARVTIKPLEYLREHGMNQGFYANRWDAPAPETKTKWELIDQASAARAFFMVGQYFSSKAE